MRHASVMLFTMILAGPVTAQPHPGDHGSHQRHAAVGQHPAPIEAGQDAFAAVAEIVRMLRADPQTDWSRVSLNRLREHLIDMHEVTLRAAVTERPIDGGFVALVTGPGRTRDAILRMVPTHARMMDGTDGWRVTADPTDGGVRLTVVSSDPAQAAIIRGLGFIGVMASGTHHQPHHLGMARGTFAH